MQFSTWVFPYEIFYAPVLSGKGKFPCLLFRNLGESISLIAALCPRNCAVCRSIAAGRMLVLIALCVIWCAARIRSRAIMRPSIAVLRSASGYAEHVPWVNGPDSHFGMTQKLKYKIIVAQDIVGVK